MLSLPCEILSIFVYFGFLHFFELQCCVSGRSKGHGLGRPRFAHPSILSSLTYHGGMNVWQITCQIPKFIVLLHIWTNGVQGLLLLRRRQWLRAMRMWWRVYVNFPLTTVGDMATSLNWRWLVILCYLGEGYISFMYGLQRNINSSVVGIGNHKPSYGVWKCHTTCKNILKSVKRLLVANFYLWTWTRGEICLSSIEK